jgi:hypothetical protein
VRTTLERRGRFSSLSHFDPTTNCDKLSDLGYLRWGMSALIVGLATFLIIAITGLLTLPRAVTSKGIISLEIGLFYCTVNTALILVYLWGDGFFHRNWPEVFQITQQEIAQPKPEEIEEQKRERRLLELLVQTTRTARYLIQRTWKPCETQLYTS